MAKKQAAQETQPGEVAIGENVRHGAGNEGSGRMGQEPGKAGVARGAWSRCAWCGVRLDRHVHLKEDDYGGACETCSAALRARARGAAPVPGC